MNYLLVLCLTLSVLLVIVNGGCWDTGCQPNSWAVKGCDQYNMRESARRWCFGNGGSGYIYSCCDRDSGVNEGCWDTGCQPNFWAVVGCEQYNMRETRRRTCNGGSGYIYSCCPKSSGGEPAKASSISLSQFSIAVTSNGYLAPTIAQYRSFMSGLPKGLITSKQEAAMALAHFLQESDGLRAKREYACANTGCPGSYETPGCDVAGQDYYGRGYIQLSWCYNYKPASRDLFNDDRLVRDPDMVARDEQIAWDTAFWFWKVNVHSKPGVAEGRFGATTRAINGALECDGPNHDKAMRRYAMYGKVRAAFGLSGPGIETGCYN